MVQNKAALILVDLQNDFMETGTLPVPHASDILPNVQRLISYADSTDTLLVASMDWHPKNHKSFASNHAGKKPLDSVELTYKGITSTQVLWPDHCIQGTPGANIVSPITAKLIVRKGTNPEIDSYSAFADNQYNAFTTMAKTLHQHDIETVVICGLALDYCVKWTCVDSVKFGFRTVLIQDATKCVVPQDTEASLDFLRSHGVHIVSSTDDFISSGYLSSPLVSP
ncbi:isochorismatase hydrolase, partial [Chlamydoabsidia padenii]